MYFFYRKGQKIPAFGNLEVENTYITAFRNKGENHPYPYPWSYGYRNNTNWVYDRKDV